jgi:hypothetical protein
LVGVSAQEPRGNGAEAPLAGNARAALALDVPQRSVRM